MAETDSSISSASKHEVMDTEKKTPLLSALLH